ncbi:hypothetical protein BMW23_0683 [Bodo saltans virus]|uniref:Uncharacterized protein n=1 Tax=Bodo saltans virus TaxID=2024608 RepID=A0A2H4UV43_9VIRU|nr:hypothetical protein QJ851_gp0666 [Bodo saltans virus]ATZ80729.1 hypothetical protein BMW23_0683 [Bodo saltans virus]
MEVSTFSNIIDEMVKENKIFRYAAELDNINNEERKNALRDILKTYKTKNLEISEKAKEQMIDVCNKINETKYKKSWNKILPEHREELLVSYFTNLIENEKERKENIDKYTELLKNGKIKNDMVEYDSKNAKIIAIKYTEQQKKKKIKKEDSESDKE